MLDVREAIRLLVTEDVKRRFEIGNEVFRQGPAALPELVEAMSSEAPEVRRTVAYVIGRLAQHATKSGQAAPVEAMEALYQGLLDGDPKVRCNCAIALGELGAEPSVCRVADALEREGSAWVRPSMILALGSIGGAEVVERLRGYEPRDSRDRAALEKVLDRLAGARAEWRFVECLPEAIPVELWTVDGLEGVVADGLRQMSVSVDGMVPGRVRASTADPRGLFAIRTFSELLIPLATAPLKPPGGVDEVKAAVADMLQRQRVLDRVLALHDGQEQPMRYRLEVRGEGLRHPIRRAIIREIAEVVAEASTRFVNSTSNYNVELRLLVEGQEARLLLRPYTIPDGRFIYRIEDVPAAVDPVVAAGVVRLAGKLRATARVLDPFCGSGTMLIERAFAGDCGEMVGIDISQAAIDAAGRNVAEAGIGGVTLVRDDMRGIVTRGQFDEVITNMPFGIRTGNHEANVGLYRDFFGLLPRVLAKGGLVLLYTQEVRLTTGLFRESRELALKGVHRVSSGGLKPAVFVGRRK